MNNILFTADPHLSHYNIIRHCNRPYTPADHDQAMIENWNSVVSRRDTVYLLGDFAMVPKQQDGTDRMKIYRKLRGAMNGKVHLVVGNHDAMSQEAYACFTAVYDFGKEIKIDGEKITLCHFPMRSWNGSFHGRAHLFGHVHGRLENVDTGVSCDVGVDVPEWDYRPVAWDVLKVKLQKKRDIFVNKYSGVKV